MVLSTSHNRHPCRRMFGVGCIEHPLKMIGDDAAFEFQRFSGFALGSSEGPIDEHHASHLPRARQPLLASGDPPRDPGQHCRMNKRCPPAQHTHTHALEGRAQNKWFRYNQRHWPRQACSDNADLRYSRVFGQHTLDFCRRKFEATAQHQCVDQSACD